MKLVIIKIIRTLFLLLDKIIPVSDKIVFSCRAGNDYADNSKYLYEYFLSKNEKKIYFYTKKKTILKLIPYNGIYAYSFKGIIVLLTSKYFVFTHGIGDFFPYFPVKKSNRIFINLFHAIAVKKIGPNKFTKAIKKEINAWDYFIVSSDFESKFIINQFGFKNIQLKVLGQSRNDLLDKAKHHSLDLKRILYAPTFRDEGELKLFPFKDLDLKALDENLLNYKIEILIRLHINDEKKYKLKEEFKELKNIKFEGSDIIPTINENLYSYDVLITDYSSIALDFLLLDRPIGYLPYDYKDYNLVRGFSFDYYKHLAGPVLTSQDDFMSFLIENNDNYLELRMDKRNLFHKFKDKKSSERIYNFIKSI